MKYCSAVFNFEFLADFLEKTAKEAAQKNSSSTILSRWQSVVPNETTRAPTDRSVWKEACPAV